MNRLNENRPSDGVHTAIRRHIFHLINQTGQAQIQRSDQSDHAEIELSDQSDQSHRHKYSLLICMSASSLGPVVEPQIYPLHCSVDMTTTKTTTTQHRI